MDGLMQGCREYSVSRDSPKGNNELSHFQRSIGTDAPEPILFITGNLDGVVRSDVHLESGTVVGRRRTFDGPLPDDFTYLGIIYDLLLGAAHDQQDRQSTQQSGTGYGISCITIVTHHDTPLLSKLPNHYASWFYLKM